MIPDERPAIEATLKELCDVEGCSLVVTTGGTGPAPRDVTPEATEAVGRRAGAPGQGSSVPATRCSQQDVCPPGAALPGAARWTGIQLVCLSLQVCERMMPGYGEQMRAIRCGPREGWRQNTAWSDHSTAGAPAGCASPCSVVSLACRMPGCPPQPALRAHRRAFTPDSGAARQEPDHQPARQAEEYPGDD